MKNITKLLTLSGLLLSFSLAAVVCQQEAELRGYNCAGCAFDTVSYWSTSPLADPTVELAVAEEQTINQMYQNAIRNVHTDISPELRNLSKTLVPLIIACHEFLRDHKEQTTSPVHTCGQCTGIIPGAKHLLFNFGESLRGINSIRRALSGLGVMKAMFTNREVRTHLGTTARSVAIATGRLVSALSCIKTIRANILETPERLEAAYQNIVEARSALAQANHALTQALSAAGRAQSLAIGQSRTEPALMIAAPEGQAPDAPAQPEEWVQLDVNGEETIVRVQAVIAQLEAFEAQVGEEGIIAIEDEE